MYLHRRGNLLSLTRHSVIITLLQGFVNIQIYSPIIVTISGLPLLMFCPENALKAISGYTSWVKISIYALTT